MSEHRKHLLLKVTIAQNGATKKCGKQNAIGSMGLVYIPTCTIHGSYGNATNQTRLKMLASRLVDRVFVESKAKVNLA